MPGWLARLRGADLPQRGLAQPVEIWNRTPARAGLRTLRGLTDLARMWGLVPGVYEYIVDKVCVKACLHSTAFSQPGPRRSLGALKSLSMTEPAEVASAFGLGACRKRQRS